MTLPEISKKFLERFVLVLEAVGDETGNTSYKNVEKIIHEEENEEMIQGAIDDDVDFRIFVTICIFTILKDIHGVEKLYSIGEIELKELVDDLFVRYLKKPIRQFSSTYGLPILNSPEVFIKVIKLGEK